MSAYTFHITPYDLAFLGIIFTGLTFMLLLWFAQKINRVANRFLSLALLVIVLWMVWLLGTDIRLAVYFPYWSCLPLQFSLAFGPFIFFYVLKITRPEYKYRWKDLLHLGPLLVEQVVFLLEIKEGIRTGAATYDTQIYHHISPILRLAAFISVITYLGWSVKLIAHFYQRLKFNDMSDRYRYEFRWLYRLLTGFGMLWLLWVPYVATDYFYYHNQLKIDAYYPLFLLLAALFIRISAVSFLRSEVAVPLPAVSKPLLPAELKQKAVWLRKTIEAGLLYQDADLTLGSLAKKVDLHPHELSRIINTVLKKNFNDFINEYRIREVTRKMQEPAYDRLTLLGIALDAGFSSKSTFNRTFRQMTGMSPAEYKNQLKKERPNYHLRPYYRRAAVISDHEAMPMWSSDKLNRSYMFKNYLKIAWRTMLHNKVYSALNIVGLATGMAVALLIGLWIYSQYDYDRFLPGYNQLYLVKLNFNYNGAIQTQTGSSLPLVEEFRKSYPEVKYASETDWGSQHSLVVDDKKLNPQGLTVGEDFLKMFPYPLVRGNVNTVFKEPSSIILTESVAKALFGNQDAVGKLIRIDNKNNVVVTGVMKDVTANSTLQFSYLLPYSYLEQTYPDTKKERTNWRNHSYPEYVELQPGTNADAFESKIKNIIAKHDPGSKIEVVLQPAKNWRLLTEFKNGKATDGFIQYVRIFGIIGILVLVIACINFVNLSTARAEKRAREVGVRKSIGSTRKDLIIQFLSESLLLTFVAFVVSILIVQLALPYFNSTTYSKISVPYTNWLFWCVMMGYVLVTGLLAGSRPAFYLSSFNPAKVLKGAIQLGKGAALPRKILVAVQFTCSIALIISTLIIYQQIKYAKDRPKGYNAYGLVMNNNSDDLRKNYTALKNDLLQSGQVVSVTTAGSGMLSYPASFTILNWPGKRQEESLEMNVNAISQDYFKTVGMELKYGNDFEGNTSADTLNIVLNEAAAQRLRLKDPLNQLITFEYSKNPMRVIGVVENAVVGSPFYAARPAIYVYNPGWAGSIMYRLKPNVPIQPAIAKIATIFNKYNPSFPYDYRFADEAFNMTFNVEVLVGTLAGIFAGLAIFISCLGLFGLAAYVAEQRKKEIGIRKVLGASVSQVWLLLSGDFILLVVVSCVIASPVAFYFLHSWLQKFDYRIVIGPAAFLLSAAAAIIITIFTVSYQAISSALANPVKSLRSE
ncbi:ABC transporter permease [Mucilaginibacter ginsenosidivorax]|uniref:FtsX-like permease family protein n=1 Tax=Mucilaginibacter ginsenosidivorax TaxID=862126 RepID=A0A5B8W674_9SPHI|nr:ABC transporter permease [Mucilaginibacter ginsenosidivorax]QEC78425.1 FtsX-like permease family protein [Mucilaginibacter ginsenosidivorax]